MPDLLRCDVVLPTAGTLRPGHQLLPNQLTGAHGEPISDPAHRHCRNTADKLDRRRDGGCDRADRASGDVRRHVRLPGTGAGCHQNLHRQPYSHSRREHSVALHALPLLTLERPEAILSIITAQQTASPLRENDTDGRSREAWLLLTISFTSEKNPRQETPESLWPASRGRP